MEMTANFPRHLLLFSPIIRQVYKILLEDTWPEIVKLFGQKVLTFFFFWLNQKVVITENLSEIIEK